MRQTIKKITLATAILTILCSFNTGCDAPLEQACQAIGACDGSLAVDAGGHELKMVAIR